MAVRSVCWRCAARRVAGVKGSGRRCAKKPRITVTPVTSASHTSARTGENCQAKSAATPQLSRYCTSSTGPSGRIDKRSTSHWIAKRWSPSRASAGGAAEAGVGVMGKSTI
ncbi:hypothetical protein D3C71_664960 [compost metagenome]